MAMTLRLNDAMSAKLRAQADANGRSQQLEVLQAIHDRLWMLDAMAGDLKAVRGGLVRAFIARPVSTRKHLYPELPTDEQVAARDARYQAMIDCGIIKPATGPLRFIEAADRWPSPPGGSLSLLDREDRF